MATETTPLLDLRDRTNKSALAFLKGSFKLLDVPDFDGPDGKATVPCISFRTNDGKGSGPQVWPLTEAESIMAALEAAHEAGYAATATKEAYIPGDALIRRTVESQDCQINDEDVECVRWRNRKGKGSKPAQVPTSEMPDFLIALRSRVDQTVEWAKANGYIDGPETDESQDDSADEG